MLTNKTLCPAEGESPERPSRLAAAAAAAMPPWLTPRDARALGIPGIDSPRTNKILITFNLLLKLKRSGKRNIKKWKILGSVSIKTNKILYVTGKWLGRAYRSYYKWYRGERKACVLTLLDSKGWWKGMGATIGRG